MTDKKHEVVQEILTETNAPGDKYFDKLYDREITCLNKLLKVIRRMKNANK